MQSSTVRRGLVGVAVGAAWLGGLYAATPLVGEFPPIALAEGFIVRAPGWLSTLAVGLLGFSAKPVLLGSVLVGVVAVAAVAWIRWPRNREWSALLGLVVGAGVTAAALVIAGVDVSPNAALALAVALGTPYAVSRLLAEPTASPDRRRFLRRAGVVVVAG
ncbi:hypothetical protein, partial [Halobellus rufus]|uniref:hypothetical protein n=1 Tax=Halobellus rufus TaxID=1448860 RepID=UPI0018CD1262